jgi:hypothetical protein
VGSRRFTLRLAEPHGPFNPDGVDPGKGRPLQGRIPFSPSVSVGFTYGYSWCPASREGRGRIIGWLILPSMPLYPPFNATPKSPAQHHPKPCNKQLKDVSMEASTFLIPRPRVERINLSRTQKLLGNQRRRELFQGGRKGQYIAVGRQ